MTSATLAPPASPADLDDDFAPLDVKVGPSTRRACAGILPRPRNAACGLAFTPAPYGCAASDPRPEPGPRRSRLSGPSLPPLQGDFDDLPVDGYDNA